MKQLNSVIIEGKLVENVKVTQVAPVAIAQFYISTERIHKNEDGTYEKEICYFDVECFGKLAERLENYLKRGRGVRVVGRLKQDIWMNGEKKCSRVIVVAEHIEVKPFKEAENDD